VSWYWGYDYVGWAPLSYYNRPVVIINNVFYDRYNYYDYPVRSRALTIVRKNQLQARNISRVTVSASSLGKISKIRLTNQAPNVKPVTRNVSLQRLQGKQVILKKSSVSSYKTTSPRTKDNKKIWSSYDPNQQICCYFEKISFNDFFIDFEQGLSRPNKKILNTPNNSSFHHQNQSNPTLFTLFFLPPIWWHLILNFRYHQISCQREDTVFIYFFLLTISLSIFFLFVFLPTKKLLKKKFYFCAGENLQLNN